MTTARDSQIVSNDSGGDLATISHSFTPPHQVSSLRKYIARGHRQVQGWLFDTAIDLLLDLARIQRMHGITGSVGEIGLHHGRLFILLHLLTAPPERSVGWDLFENQDLNIDSSGLGDRSALMLNIRSHYCDAERVIINTANSLELAPRDVLESCGDRPRVFSIDGGHTAQVTLHDLELAANTVRDDGLIVVDDFFNEPWPGVAEGVCRYMRDPLIGLYPVAIGGNKFVFTKSQQMAATYQRELALPQKLYTRRLTTAFENPVVVYKAHPGRLLRRRMVTMLRRWRWRNAVIDQITRKVTKT